MDFDPFGSLTEEKDPQLLSSNWDSVSNEAENNNLVARTEEPADQVNDLTFSPLTAQGVDVENCGVDVLENEAISQQEDKYETSTDKIETTVWTADNEPPKTSQIKVKQV